MINGSELGIKPGKLCQGRNNCRKLRLIKVVAAASSVQCHVKDLHGSRGIIDDNGLFMEFML